MGREVMISIEELAERLDVAKALMREIIFENDEMTEDDHRRWQIVREWVRSNINGNA